jgi:hypothetical protein
MAETKIPLFANEISLGPEEKPEPVQVDQRGLIAKAWRLFIQVA